MIVNSYQPDTFPAPRSSVPSHVWIPLESEHNTFLAFLIGNVVITLIPYDLMISHLFIVPIDLELWHSGLQTWTTSHPPHSGHVALPTLNPDCCCLSIVLWGLCMVVQ